MEREQLIRLAKEYFDDRDFVRYVTDAKEGGIFEQTCTLTNEYRLEVTIDYSLIIREEEHSSGYLDPSWYSVEYFEFEINYQTFQVIDTDDNEIDITEEMELDGKELSEWIYDILAN